MRKALIFMIAANLLLGVSGCGSGSPAQDAQTMVEIANAGTVANAINAHNALYPGNVLPDNATLGDAKEALGEL